MLILPRTNKNKERTSFRVLFGHKITVLSIYKYVIKFDVCSVAQIHFSPSPSISLFAFLSVFSSSFCTHSTAFSQFFLLSILLILYGVIFASSHA